MPLEDKPLEDLEACEARIGRELRKRYEERTLSEGGFRCTVCQRVFGKKSESGYYPGVCQEDGYRMHINMVRDSFEEISENHSDVEIAILEFSRSKRTPIVNLVSSEKAGTIDLENGQEAVVNTLILKIGNKFAEISVKLPDSCDDFDDVKITMVLHSKAPLIQGSDDTGFRYTWPEDD